MLVCVPSQPCRWRPVQPVKKKDVCACMCVCRRVVRTCLRRKEQSEGIWPPYTARGKSTDCIVYERYAIIYFSVFVVSCFDWHRGSQASDWISILPHENPKRSFFSASFCTQGRPNFECIALCSAYQALQQTFAVASCLESGNCAAWFYLSC